MSSTVRRPSAPPVSSPFSLRTPEEPDSRDPHPFPMSGTFLSFLSPFVPRKQGDPEVLLLSNGDSGVVVPHQVSLPDSQASVRVGPGHRLHPSVVPVPTTHSTTDTDSGTPGRRDHSWSYPGCPGSHTTPSTDSKASSPQSSSRSARGHLSPAPSLRTPPGSKSSLKEGPCLLWLQFLWT